MKRSLFALLAIIFLVTLALPTRSGMAQTVPADPTWNSSIFYYNPTGEAGELQVTYFDASGVKTGESQTLPVAAHGSGEIFVGETSATANTEAAVLASSVPVMAVYEQSRSLADPNYGRLLYTAFDQDQSDDLLYVPDFIFDTKGYQTRVGVQNVDATGPTDVNLTFFDGNGAPVATGATTGLPYQASWVFNKGDTTFTPTASFNGSLLIDANPGDAKQVVAAVEQWQADGRRDYAFEAIPAKETATKVFMPTFQCRYSRGGQTTQYIIMNAGDAATTVKVTAYDEAKRAQIGVPTALKVGAGTTLLPNQKAVFNACEIKGATSKSGSAVVESSGEELAVIGKVIGSDGLTTTFSAKKEGFNTVVLPYVVWVANQVKGYRTSISIMNVGGANATNVRARYYQLDGSLLKEVSLTPATKPLKPYNRVSTTPSSAKALRTDKSFRGAVEIVSDQPVIVVVRMERKISGVKGTTMLGEDYTGIPYVETE